jgi:predicted secreted hydrolase
MRRRLLHGLACLVLVFAVSTRAAAPVYPTVIPGQALLFPRDFGAHPDFRTEWWYTTGWLTTSEGKRLGFQITFFRSRLDLDEANPSRFAPKQIVFAHAALSDPGVGYLLHDQRAARAGFGLAEAKEGNTEVWIDDWSLRRSGDAYRAQLRSREFALELLLTPAQPVLLQGDAGMSRKGPQPPQASYYYSEPHLQIAGTVTRNGKPEAVRGTAWLDHEWSTAYLDPNAAGWDWTGINLEDGGALMLFRIRAKDGSVLWAGGTLRRADGRTQAFGPKEVSFTAERRWRSPRTAIEYPVVMRVTAPGVDLELMPAMDDQELDSRATTGTLYWEGAVTAQSNGRAVGVGYLELTGYASPLRL